MDRSLEPDWLDREGGVTLTHPWPTGMSVFVLFHVLLSAVTDSICEFDTTMGDSILSGFVERKRERYFSIVLGMGLKL